MSNYVLTSQAVRKLRGALAATPGNSGAAGAPSPVNIDDFPPPFTVRWSASADDGEGAWLIWLPGLGNLIAVDGLFVSTIGGATAATGLPAGWYTIDDADGQSSDVYLIITVNTYLGTTTAELSPTAGQAVTGETVYNVLVAAMAQDATTKARSVKQFVESVVTFSTGAGGGGGGGGGDDLSCWRIIEASGVHGFGNQYYCRGESIVDLSLPNTVESFVAQDLYYVALRVPAYAGANGGETLQGYATLADVKQAQTDPAYVTRLLYLFNAQGDVVVDFRNCPALQLAEAL